MSTRETMSRRTWLKGMALSGSRSEMGCGMMAGMGPGMMGAGACQLVQGRISPMGYCDLYVPLGA